VLCAQLALIAGLLLQRTRRQRAELALSESEERYRNVVETQTELICRFLPDTTLTFVNDAFCRFWGKAPNELIGTKFLTLIPVYARESVVRRIASVVETPHTDTLEHEVLLANGGIGWQQWTNLAVVGADGRVRELQGVGRDITQRRRAEDGLREHQTALNASYKRIHDLAGRLIAGQETERHRIARELHDDLSQKLALLTIDIEQLARGGFVRVTGLAKRVREISKRAAEIATDVHRLSHELHPTRLEALGLVAAVRTICRDVGHQHGIAVDFRYTRVPNRHSTASGTLFLSNRAGRIAQRGQAQRRQAGVGATDWRRRRTRPRHRRSRARFRSVRRRVDRARARQHA
jgi:PAS domain S-box-containing protein